MTTTDKILAAVAAGVVISTAAVTIKDIDDKDVTKHTLTKTALVEVDAKYKTLPVLDSKTAEVIKPAGSLHTFGQGEAGDCEAGDRYTTLQWDNTTIEKLAPAELEPCYSLPVQLFTEDMTPFVHCQIECTTWLAMQGHDDGGPQGGDDDKPWGGDSDKVIVPVVIKK